MSTFSLTAESRGSNASACSSSSWTASPWACISRASTRSATPTVARFCRLVRTLFFRCCSVFACDIDYCTACLRLSFPFFGTRVIWLKRHVFGCICLCWVRREILVFFILSGCWYFENCFSFKYLVCSSSRCLLVICMYLIFSLSPSMCVLFFLKADVSSTLSQRRA